MRHVLCMTANTQFKETKMETQTETPNVLYDNIESSQQLHIKWLAEHNEAYPPVRVKSPHDADPDFPGVWFDGEMFRNISPESLYVPPVKRGRGRPRKIQQ